MKGTIRKKLILAIGLVVSLTIIVGVISINLIIKKNEEAYIEKDIMSVGDFSKRYILTEVVLGNKTNNYNIVNTVSDLFKVHVSLKVDNKLISNGKIYYQKDIDNFTSKIDTSKAILKYYLQDNLSLGTLYMPIYIDNDYYGTFIIQKDYSEIHSTNSSIIKSTSVVMLSMLSILIVMISIIVKSITSPLEKLTIGIRKFGQGKKIDDIKVKSKDEIGDLTLEFNTMKNNITKLQNTSKEFFDNATHELKTPLTVIRGYTQLLKEEEYNNLDVQIMLDQVENETTKMNRLVKKLLDLSKYDLEIKTIVEEVEVKSLMIEIIKAFKMEIEEKGYDILLDLEDFKINCVKEDLEVLISNLINNAIVHSTGKIISIELNGKGVLKISNEASNINDNIKNRLLDPFVKGSNKNSSGVGLYICNRIADKNKYKFKYKIENNYISFIIELI